MNPIRHWLAALLVLGGLFFAPTSARAETFHTCAGFITSLPATISTQGVWCLKQDLTTAITSGGAIIIATNNVTIDCNDFKLGGLQAGNGSTASGIFANGYVNANIRHCNVRGFNIGVNLENGSGHLVEDNRLDQNLYIGIYVDGDNNRVRRNAVYDTGGHSGYTDSYGINVTGDVIDNTVSGVFAATLNTNPHGIAITGSGSEARDNRVGGLVVAGAGSAYGINASGTGIRLVGNQIAAAALTPGYGILGNGVNTACSENAVTYFGTAYYSCEYTFGNLP